jgi:hypothetical protein
MTPGASLDIAWPWGEEWLPAGDTISSYTLTPSPGVTVDSHSQAAGTVTAWVTLDEMLAENTRADVECKITTAEGRIDARLFRLVAIKR